MPTTASTTTGGGPSICQQLESQIKSKQGQITKWKQKLEDLLNDTTSNLTDVLGVKDILSGIDKEILTLKENQRKNGCPISSTTANSLDNQTVISTNTVRKKEATALDIVPMPPPPSATAAGGKTTP